MNARAILTFIVLLLFLLVQTVSADDYISDPSNIPLLDNFKTPQIKPGDKGSFGLSIGNRYDGDITNATLTVSVYAVATTYIHKEIKDVEHPPKINGQGTEYSFSFQNIKNDTMVYVNFTIKSSTDTTQGTYFIRFQFDFQYLNDTFLMRSRGYFTNEEWENATASGDGSDPGKIDIDQLDVDGIIPDSSFKVWEPISIWPLYVCIIPTIVLIGILAILFYAQEEYNMFPWLEQGFKYWTGKLHQSWRLFKHRFRKA
jgi:hypothetical protein